jgi:hypothetical protein
MCSDSNHHQIKSVAVAIIKQKVYCSNHHQTKMCCDSIHRQIKSAAVAIIIKQKWEVKAFTIKKKVQR